MFPISSHFAAKAQSPEKTIGLKSQIDIKPITAIYTAKHVFAVAKLRLPLGYQKRGDQFRITGVAADFCLRRPIKFPVLINANLRSVGRSASRPFHKQDAPLKKYERFVAQACLVKNVGGLPTAILLTLFR